MEVKKTYKKVGKIFLFIAFNLSFSFVVILLAYNNRTKIKRWMDHDNSFSKEDKVIMYDIFSSPLITNEEDLVWPAVKNSDDLINYLFNSTLPDSLNLLKIYDSCRILSTAYYRGRVLKIKYILFKDTLESYVYLNKISTSGKDSHTAVLHIPGSGDNRSGQVVRRLLDKEDPVRQAKQINADIFIPVHPANDIRAIHDGTKMLDVKKIASYVVSIDRSFSLRYFADIFSIEKYLRTKYSSLQTWGHSRGGSVATVASSIFLPDTLIVSSGYSVMANKFFRLGSDQAWWPNSSKYWDKNLIKEKLRNKKTVSYFLFGKKEVDDIYGLETKYFYTEKFFKDCPNIKVRYSDKKHMWFSDEVSKILAGK
ncbi:MAG: hypothetical protein SGI96_15730 [Bacteroidota bacterium]|nr:hypothetical protein [Bacteroidota bacterium]